MATRRSLGLLLGLAALSFTVGGQTAWAQSDEVSGVLQIRRVDSRGLPLVELEVFYAGSPEEVAAATVTENDNGRSLSVAPTPLGVSDRPVAVVLAVDTSEAVADGLEQVKEGLLAFIETKPANQQIAILSLSDAPRVAQQLTADVAELTAAVGRLTPSGGAALWDGVDAAATILEETEGAQPNVVLVAAGGDTASQGSIREARGALATSGAALVAVGLQQAGLSSEALASLVDTGGGLVLVTDSADGMVDELVRARTFLDGQYVLSYESGLEAGQPADVTVTIGDDSTTASFVAGSNIEGGSALQPRTPVSPGGVGFLQGDNVKLITVGLVLAAATLGAYAMGMIFQGGRSALSTALRPYSEDYGLESEGGEEGSGGDLATGAVLQRAVELTGRIAERQGLLERVANALDRANLPLRAAEALFFYILAAVIAAIVVVLLTSSVLLTAVVFGLMIMVPWGVVNYLGARRQKQFVGQLPDTLQLLSGTLRAGYSLQQGVEAVSQEIDDPMGDVLRRTMTESRLGRPLEDSLDAAVDRMDSPDFAWTVMAIRIQREVGGNLAELLLTVAETMTERERLRRDVASLTAEGKISAIVLGLLPLLLGLAMWVINPEYVGLLITERVGNIMLGGSIVLAGFGFWWMKKTIEIEI